MKKFFIISSFVVLTCVCVAGSLSGTYWIYNNQANPQIVFCSQREDKGTIKFVANNKDSMDLTVLFNKNETDKEILKFRSTSQNTNARGLAQITCETYGVKFDDTGIVIPLATNNQGVEYLYSEDFENFYNDIMLNSYVNEEFGDYSQKGSYPILDNGVKAVGYKIKPADKPNANDLSQKIPSDKIPHDYLLNFENGNWTVNPDFENKDVCHVNGQKLRVTGVRSPHYYFEYDDSVKTFNVYAYKNEKWNKIFNSIPFNTKYDCDSRVGYESDKYFTMDYESIVYVSEIDSDYKVKDTFSTKSLNDLLNRTKTEKGYGRVYNVSNHWYLATDSFELEILFGPDATDKELRESRSGLEDLKFVKEGDKLKCVDLKTSYYTRYIINNGNHDSCETLGLNEVSIN